MFLDIFVDFRYDCGALASMLAVIHLHLAEENEKRDTVVMRLRYADSYGITRSSLVMHG